MNFGNKLQNLRKEKKLSQEALAEKLNVSRQAVSKWESNQSYPEMEKLIEMTKIFECTLDDLTNKEKTSESIKKEKSKNPLNDFVEDIANIINKSINMFTDMKGEEIFKLIFVMILVAIGIGLIRIPVDKIYYMVTDIFANFGIAASNILSSILYLIINVVYIVGGLLIFFYIYKVIYLDKYNENREKNNVIEKEEINKNIAIEKEDKIKYNDKTMKDTSKGWAVLSIVGKIVMFFVKLIAAFIAIPFLAYLVILSFCIALSIYLIIKGIIIIGVPILIVSMIMISSVILTIIVNLIFNKKTNAKNVLIIFLIGTILFGAGVGVTSIEITNYKFINKEPSGFVKEIVSKEFSVNDNLTLEYHWYNENINYNVDNSKETILITIEYYKDMSLPVISQVGNIISIKSTEDEINFDVLNKIIGNLKDKTIYNYNLLTDYKITITGSEKNIEVLKNNMDLNNNSISNYNENLLEENTRLKDECYKIEMELKNAKIELEKYKQKIRDLAN